MTTGRINQVTMKEKAVKVSVPLKGRLSNAAYSKISGLVY